MQTQFCSSHLWKTLVKVSLISVLVSPPGIGSKDMVSLASSLVKMRREKGRVARAGSQGW